jgi:hypothetical protein
MESMVTAKQVAEAAGIAPATKQFVICDEYGLAHDGFRCEHVLAAISRSDMTPKLSAEVHRTAYAVLKCFSTARMDVYLARRVREDYSPYRLCALVAQVANNNPDANVGELADFWINEHAKEL